VKRESTAKAGQRAAVRKAAKAHDWTEFDALTNSEILKAARSDPDGNP